MSYVPLNQSDNDIYQNKNKKPYNKVSLALVNLLL